jgi:hypothetical protein
MLLVVEPSTYPYVAWLLIVLSSIDVGGVPAIHPIYTGPDILYLPLYIPLYNFIYFVIAVLLIPIKS